MQRDGNTVYLEKYELKPAERLDISQTMTVDQALQRESELQAQVASLQQKAESLVGNASREAQAMRNQTQGEINVRMSFARKISELCAPEIAQRFIDSL